MIACTCAQVLPFEYAGFVHSVKQTTVRVCVPSQVADILRGQVTSATERATESVCVRVFLCVRALARTRKREREGETERERERERERESCAGKSQPYSPGCTRLPVCESAYKQAICTERQKAKTKERARERERCTHEHTRVGRRRTTSIRCGIHWQRGPAVRRWRLSMPLIMLTRPAVTLAGVRMCVWGGG